jgi:hypothetical protein
MSANALSGDLCFYPRQPGRDPEPCGVAPISPVLRDDQMPMSRQSLADGTAWGWKRFACADLV